jgi:hypothetical protein
MPLDVYSINLNNGKNAWFQPFEVECIKKADTLSNKLIYTLQLHPVLIIAKTIETMHKEKVQDKDLLLDLYPEMFLLTLDYLENEYIINNFKSTLDA